MAKVWWVNTAGAGGDAPAAPRLDAERLEEFAAVGNVSEGDYLLARAAAQAEVLVGQARERVARVEMPDAGGGDAGAAESGVEWFGSVERRILPDFSQPAGAGVHELADDDGRLQRAIEGVRTSVKLRGA